MINNKLQQLKSHRSSGIRIWMKTATQQMSLPTLDDWEIFESDRRMHIFDENEEKQCNINELETALSINE